MPEQQPNPKVRALLERTKRHPRPKNHKHKGRMRGFVREIRKAPGPRGTPQAIRQFQQRMKNLINKANKLHRAGNSSEARKIETLIDFKLYGR